MPSVIGYHYSTGGTKDGIGGWIDYATGKGIPVGLKGVSDYGLIFEAIQKGNPGWFVYRLSAAAGSVSREVPNYTTDPVIDAEALAAEAIAKLPPEFDKTKVWVELINEPRGKWTDEPVWGGLHPVDYLGEWCLAAAEYLNAQGYKFCGPSFNSGEPGDDGEPLSDATAQYLQPGMRAYLQCCADNPDMAALAVHDYGWDEPKPWYPHLWGRWEAAIAAADMAGIPRTFHIFVTEFGYSPKNAPEYPAVSPDLDQYNQIAARFPQVKFAAAWTLQNGYDPVDSQILTWIDYPIDKEFDRGPQPAVTHAAFGGTLPDEPEEPMPDNLLRNADFEGGYDTEPGHDNIRYPKGWDFWYAPESFPNPIAPNDPNAILRQPEAHVLGREDIPDHEEDDFIYDGDHTWKVFGKNRSIYFTLGQDLPAGTYDLSFHIFTDMYEWVGSKDFCDDPHCCVIWVETDQGKTAEIRPPIGQPNYLTFRINVGDGGFDVHFLFTWAVDNNGAWIDGFSAKKIEEPTMTWEQQAWQLGIQNKVLGFRTGAGLQKRITADGYQALSNEVPFTRPDGVKLVIQRAKHAVDGTFRTYYVIPPNYETIHVIDEETGTGGSDDEDPKVEDVIDQLATHEWLTYTNRPLSAITTLTIHHSVSGGGPNPLAEVKAIAQYHVSPRPPDVPDGWPGIGYHFCIGADGIIYQVNHLETKSYHAGSWNAPGDENYWSAGICLLGNFTYSPPPQAQLDAARGLVAYLKGELPTATAVTRHKDMPGAQTQCPGNTNPQWFGYVAGEAANDIDLLPYLRGDGRLYEVRNADGGQERMQTQPGPNAIFYQTKNSAWEELWANDTHIVRDKDTSPGGGRYYRMQTSGGIQGGPFGKAWIPRHWQPGGIFSRDAFVQFYHLSDCSPSSPNSGDATDTMKFVARHSTYTFRTGITLSDVVELLWVNGGEKYFYARGFGLVGWEREHEDPQTPQWSAISEIHEPGTRPDNVREIPPCL